jgi:chemotaxis protein MotB
MAASSGWPRLPPPELARSLALGPTPAEDDNTAWLVTFSDLVLQLFAFVLVAVVIGAPARTTVLPPATAVTVPARNDSPLPDRVAPVPPRSASAPDPSPPVVVPDPLPATAATHSETHETAPPPAEAPPEDSPAHRLEALGTYLNEITRAEGHPDAVRFSVRDADLVLSLSDRISFPSGSADLLPSASPILGAIRALVDSLPGFTVSVEGHTDDVPIHTPAFPSNLELSLARAARVAHELVGSDADLRARTAATGFGEHRPAVPNADPEGRAQNRRVEIRLIPPEHPPT